jgi:uncharacterized protein involved in outer membrane biogenesis
LAVSGIVVAGIVLLVVFFLNLLRGPLAGYPATSSTERWRSPVISRSSQADHSRPDRRRRSRTSNGRVINRWPPRNALSFGFTPGSLLRGEPIKAQLADADVPLERNADARQWHLGSDAPAPRIGNVVIENGSVRFRDAKERADLKLQLQSLISTGDDHQTLRFYGRGTWHGEAVQVEGKSPGPAQRQDIDAPYRMILNVRAGGTSLNFDGTVVPAETENLRGALRVQGPDLSKLYPLVPAPLPWTPPYNLAGELVHTKGRGSWEFLGMKGTVGESDLKGNVRIDVSKPRSMLTADLTSGRFDSRDLGGFLGLPPGDAAQHAQTAEQQAEATRRTFSYRVLPDKPLELAKLRAHDAEVNFRGTSVKWSALPLDNLTAHLKLKDGVLNFQPLDFGIADGHVIANVKVDVTQVIAKAEGEFEARNVELKRLFPKLASPNGTAGRFGGRAHFKTQGNTVAEMLAAADGDAAVIMRGGEASTLQLVLTNLDLARAAQLLLRGDETAEIRCAVGSLHAKGGIMTPDLFEVDTSAVVISGEGNVDFRDEKYDLALKARSKRPSLLALRGPIVIGGTFKTPVVGFAVGPVAARAGAAARHGGAPLALLPLMISRCVRPLRADRAGITATTQRTHVRLAPTPRVVAGEAGPGERAAQR